MSGGRIEGQKSTQEVIERVADKKGVLPTKLSPLYEVIDPDALNSLFDYDQTIQEETGQVQFEYEGHTVIVNSSGRVGVSETSD